MIAPLPPDEAERLKALRSLGLLNTPPEPSFDDLTRLAALVCETPIAAISLVDSHRQWFKSRVGLEAMQTPRDIAFCSHAILQNDLFMIPDASADKRFKDNPLVLDDPNIRFYAGMPLTDPAGHNLGTLCVIDRVPKSLSPQQQDALRVLARQVTAQIVMRQHVDEMKSVIAERDRVEAALQASERNFQAIYKRAPLGVSIVDSEGRFLHVNPKYEEITRRTEAELRKLKFQDITHPDDLETDLRNMTSLVRGKTPQFQMEKRYLRGDGSVVWVNLTVVPLQDTGQTPLRQLAIAEDITERKQAEEQLRTRESQLSGILDNTSAVIYLKDHEGRFLLTNRRYQDLFERNGESSLGKTDLEIFPKETARQFLESDAKVWREQVPIDFEEAVAQADGQHTYRSVKFPVRDESGKMIALGGISTDITDLKAAYEDLKNKEGLLRNLIEVQENEKQFLCHEIHDGLMQYAVGSRMLLEGYRNSRPASDDLSQIDTVISYLLKGIEDGRRVIRGVRPAVLDNSGIEAALDDLVGQYATSGIMVTSKCDPEIGRLPEMIQTTIYRVVQESLNNAKKYSGTDVVRIELRMDDGSLHLEVRDFGCGFDVESARKRGFGLVGMTERVRLLGGECLIQSEQDAGTRISVRLPISAADGESEVAKQSDAAEDSHDWSV